jgi:hypothetical protein
MNEPAAGADPRVRSAAWAPVLAGALLLFATSALAGVDGGAIAKGLEPAAKLLGLLGGAIAWGYQVRGKMRREKIKADLEILQLARQEFGDGDERVRAVYDKVRHLMSYLYRNPSARQLRLIAVANVALCALCIVGAWDVYRIACRTWDQGLDKSAPPLFGVALLTLFAIWSALNAFDELSSRKNR